MRIERHSAVIECDLPEIYAFIAKDSPAAAERVTFSEILANPEAGVVYPPHNSWITDVRMLPVSGFSNYLVFYRIEGEAVRILYVVHGARHLPRLFSREQRS